MESDLAKLGRFMRSQRLGSQVYDLFVKRAGDKADTLATAALVVADETGKELGRAMADVLEAYRR